MVVVRLSRITLDSRICESRTTCVRSAPKILPVVLFVFYIVLSYVHFVEFLALQVELLYYLNPLL